MGALSLSSLEVLRRPVSLRSVLVWLLLALLLAGAASYTKGSRYAIVPAHSAGLAAVEQAAASAPLPHAQSAAGPAATSVAASSAVCVLHAAALPSTGSEELEKDCCERRRAPRGEPVPVRTGVVDPPSLIQPQPAAVVFPSIAPLPPGLKVLTVVELSISRT